MNDAIKIQDYHECVKMMLAFFLSLIPVRYDRTETHHVLYYETPKRKVVGNA